MYNFHRPVSTCFLTISLYFVCALAIGSITQYFSPINIQVRNGGHLLYNFIPIQRTLQAILTSLINLINPAVYQGYQVPYLCYPGPCKFKFQHIYYNLYFTSLLATLEQMDQIHLLSGIHRIIQALQVFFLSFTNSPFISSTILAPIKCELCVGSFIGNRYSKTSVPTGNIISRFHKK